MRLDFGRPWPHRTRQLRARDTGSTRPSKRPSPPYHLFARPQKVACADSNAYLVDERDASDKKDYKRFWSSLDTDKVQFHQLARAQRPDARSGIVQVTINRDVLELVDDVKRTQWVS
ncbi:hypothetical protein PsorP6_013351 [Peronosclerospora sorghi]|uniref:Uncharacterized protein n=1 Tax=Peronosclerospora sorghi TaxID=230839 RepID=A0ACC0WI98_9STRA|nr:hypothetical protein PsorP6_013351 [Peronosclerospora sorghi]